MPYRTPGRPPGGAPRSPDLDEDLLARPTSSKLLLVSILYTPFVLWVVWMIQSGDGPRQISPDAKVAFTLLVALVNVVLVVIHARHRARMRAVLARLTEDDVTDPARVRVVGPPADDAPGEDDGAAAGGSRKREA